MAAPPSIIDGPKLQVRRVTEFEMPCPKCSKDIRVTAIEAGAVIKCPHTKCGNVTWRPEYVPPWWARTRNFSLAIIGSFSVGIISSLVASRIYEEYTKSRDAIVKPDATAIIPPP